MSYRHVLTAMLLAFTALAVAQQKPEVSLWVASDIAPGPKIKISVSTRNAPFVRVEAHRIDPIAWLSRPETHYTKPAPVGGFTKRWEMRVARSDEKPAPKPQDTYYTNEIKLPGFAPGVYLITANSSGAKEAWAVVNVTNLAVVAKRSPNHLLAWVTDAMSGRVVGGAKVAAYTQKGEFIRAESTGPDGVSLLNLRPGSGAVVVSRGGDYAGLPANGQNPDGRLVAHFQTDRPIYRPGQKVFFKSILRKTLGRGYAPIPNVPATVEVRDPKDTVIDRLNLRSNEMGSVAGGFDLPDEGATGSYTLRLAAVGQSAYQTFTVAEYRKPEFKVDAKPAQKRYLAGDEIRFEIDAQYYFGAPLAQAEVRYEVRRTPLSFWGFAEEDRWFYGGDGNLYPRDTYSSQPFVAQDVVHTDANGKATIIVKSDASQPDSTYTATVTVTDGSRRQVRASTGVPVYAALLRVALRSDLLYVPLGKLIPIDVRVTDLDGRPTAGRVTLSLIASEWDDKRKTLVERVLEKTSIDVPASGKARANLPAKKEGSLTIRVSATDSTGRKTKTEMDVYVAGPFAKQYREKEQPSVVVRLDRRVYEIGQTISTNIETNRDKRPILVTLEGGDVWAYRVFPPGSRSRTWPVPATIALSPNAYVTAEQWAENGLISASKIVPVPDRSRRMKLEIQPDKEVYKPGETATYRLTTLDSQGLPIPAEIALSVVDEAIFALRPDATADLYGFYWGLRQNAVSTTSSAPQEVSGGAYQRVNTVAPVRQRFEDTAYWNAFLTTGTDGTGSVSFEMPGNLTAWRATARGITADTKVGAATESVKASRPVTLRLATPRQMVQRDVLTLIGTVNNRSDREHRFEVSLSPEGVRMLGPARLEIVVAAGGEGRVEWQLEASDLPEQGSAKLTGQVVPLDMTGEDRVDYADALAVSVRVVPDGVQDRIVVGGAVSTSADVVVDLPEDKIEPASIFRVRLWAGLGPVADRAGRDVFTAYRYGTLVAADQLIVAAALGMPSGAKEVREALALLSRTESNSGWGWWEGAPADPSITATVLEALFQAKSAGIEVPQPMLEFAKNAAKSHFAQTSLWEHRARLAAAVAPVDQKLGAQMVDEVLSRGINLSPFAKLKLAGALFGLGKIDPATAVLDEVLKDASEGPSSTYVPVGFGIGWTASEIETTAEALSVFQKAKIRPELQARLARWLASPGDERWLNMDEQAAIAKSLSAYLAEHPDAPSLAHVEVSLNGVEATVKPDKVGNAAVAEGPRSAIKAGRNVVSIRRSGSGEAFYEIEARVYRPRPDENERGIRVLRRFEVRNDAGVWVELTGPIKPGEPVRCTTVVWGDSVEDAIKVVQPIPAGFEYVDQDSLDYSKQEVRDGAVINYVLAGGTPLRFRYYIRAESEGTLVALPATAEVIRRPSRRGQSSRALLEVRAK